MNERNIGRFRVSTELIREEPEKIAFVFAQLKIVTMRAEALWATNEIDYVAISERFAEIPASVEPPYYDIIIESDSVGWPETIEVREIGLAENVTGLSGIVIEPAERKE